MTSRARALLFCAATQYWEEAWFRKQHFMQRLSRHRDVVYVEPSFSLLRAVPSACPAGQANPWLAPRLRQRGERLWTLTPPRGLPFWTHPAVSRRQYRLYGRMLRAAARRLGYERVWLWLYNPLFVQAADTLRPERLILDLVDEMGAYEARSHSRRTMQACVEEAIEQADLVLATSRRLAESYAPRTRSGRIHVVSNGVRAEWIDRRPDPPGEIAALPRPRLGLVGALFSYLDYDLLGAAARAFPGGSLILVGPVLDAAGVARVGGEPNVHLLGPRPQEDVPACLAGFDVCLCPFRGGEVRRAVNPLKIYEYLAAGRPVVSTPLESLREEPVARWIRFAEGADAFTAAIRAALEEGGDEEGRREAVRPYTWESLGERVEAILEQAERRWDGGPEGRREAEGARDV